MAWEMRRGRRYYYHKRRVGGRVVSEYRGSGDWVDAVTRLEQADRIERAVERDDWRSEQNHIKADESALDEVTALIETLTTSYLLAAGCHTHKGTWRRRR